MLVVVMAFMISWGIVYVTVENLNSKRKLMRIILGYCIFLTAVMLLTETIVGMV